MNQQSCQKALLKCSEINKRRHKDERKVRRLLSRVIRELPTVYAASGSGGVAGSQTPDAHVPHHNIQDQGIEKIPFNESFAPSTHRHRESTVDLRGVMEIDEKRNRQETLPLLLATTAKRRKDVDSLMKHVWRSHQNAVKMERMMGRTIELLKKATADESPCHTIVSHQDFTKFRDAPVPGNSNTIKSGSQNIADLSQLLQWQASHSKQDNGETNLGHIRYGESGLAPSLLQEQQRAIGEYLDRSTTTAADLTRLLPSTGVKSLDKLRPPPEIAPQLPKIFDRVPPQEGQYQGPQFQGHHNDSAAKNFPMQPQLLTTKVGLPKHPSLGESGALQPSPSQYVFPPVEDPSVSQRRTQAQPVKSSPQKQPVEKRQRGRPRKNNLPTTQDDASSRVKKVPQRPELQRQQSLSSMMMRDDEGSTLVPKRTPHFKQKLRQLPIEAESQSEESKGGVNDEPEDEELEEPSIDQVPLIVQQKQQATHQSESITSRPQDADKSKAVSKVKTNDTTRPSDKQDSEERQQCSKEPVQSEAHRNSVSPESDDEDESDEDSSSSEDERKPKRPPAEKGLFKPPSVAKSSYQPRRQVQPPAIPESQQVAEQFCQSQIFSAQIQEIRGPHQGVDVKQFGMTRIRSIEIHHPSNTGMAFPKTHVAEFERGVNNLTPIPSQNYFIENPEQFGSNPDPYRFGNFDLHETNGFGATGFQFGMRDHLDSIDAFNGYPGPQISPRPSPSLGASNGAMFKSRVSSSNLAAIGSSNSFALTGNYFESDNNRLYDGPAYSNYQQTAAFGANLLEEVASPGALDQRRNLLDSQGE